MAIQTRVANPLMPLRVIRDRDRGGSYLAVGITGAYRASMLPAITAGLERWEAHLGPTA